MNRTALISFLLFVVSLTMYSQSKQIVSITSGTTRYRGNSYGLDTEYQVFIEEHFSFALGAGYYSWESIYKNNQLKEIRNQDLRVSEKVSFSPFSVGFKYYFGDHKLIPIVTVNWAFNLSSINIYNYYANNLLNPPTETRKKIGSRSILEVTYSLGIGCMYKISDNIHGIFSFAPYFGGEYSEGVRFNVGVAYLFMQD